jgi:hypothetical protein
MPPAVKPVLIEQDNYEVALRLAQERWRTMDPLRQAARSGAETRLGQGVQCIVSVPFLGRTFEASHPDGLVRLAEEEAPPPLWEQILVMHYLSSERPVPETDRVIAYSEIPDGKFYDDAYQRRTKSYLLKVFGAAPERLLEAAHSLDAEPAAMGDVAVRVRAFPFVDIYLLLWRGDDEFPPEASVLLGERIQGFLDAEDTAVLAGLVVGHLAKAASRNQS